LGWRRKGVRTLFGGPLAAVEIAVTPEKGPDPFSPKETHMRIGIMSDTHDCLPMIAKAVDAIRQADVEHVLHAGDFIAPFAVKALAGLGAPIIGVFGNNDGERAGVKAAFDGIGEVRTGPTVVELAERRILLGHEPSAVRRRGRDGDFDLWVYGHTHEAEVTRNTTLTVNPGEVCGYLSGRGTLAVVDLESMEAELIEL